MPRSQLKQGVQKTLQSQNEIKSNSLKCKVHHQRLCLTCTQNEELNDCGPCLPGLYRTQMTLWWYSGSMKITKSVIKTIPLLYNPEHFHHHSSVHFNITESWPKFLRTDYLKPTIFQWCVHFTVRHGKKGNKATIGLHSHHWVNSFTGRAQATLSKLLTLSLPLWLNYIKIDLMSWD